MKKKLNNNGSSFITVLVCIIFIAMLGMMVISLTSLNVRLKEKQKQEKIDFYQCEIALDEIRTGLQQDVIEKCVKKSYIDFLEVYSTNKDYETNKNEASENYYYDHCIGHFVELFTAEFNSSKVPSNDQLKIKLGRYISNPASVTLNDSMIYLHQNNQIIIRNVQVSYNNGDKHSKITTDLVIKFPGFGDVAEGSSMQQFDKSYKNYAIVADGTVTCSIGNSIITGSMYAGGGLDVPISSNLSFFGDQLITRNDINVNYNSRLQIGSINKDVSVWAKNISTILSNTNFPTVLLMNGLSKRSNAATQEYHKVNCFVQDDLSLDAKNSICTMNGNYYGYTKIDSTNPTELGSSIVVNGANSKLDMRNLTDLVLAGNAYISFPDETTHQDVPEILMGESIGIKGNQYAYLIPAEYMKLGHNPITEEEYHSPLNNDPVDMDKLKKDYKLDNPLDDYHLDYKAVEYNMAGGAMVIYYYVNPLDTKTASKYFDQYIKKHTDTWSELGSDAFRMKSVEIDATTNVYSSGNVVTYKINDENKVKQKKFDPNTKYDEVEVKINGAKRELDELDGFYQTLSYSLKEEVKSAGATPDPTQDLPSNPTADTPFSYYIDTGKLTTPSQSVNGEMYFYNKYITSDYLVKTPEEEHFDAKYHVVVTDKDNYIVDERDNGIIVATQDVTVAKDFTGLIFAGGNVKIESGINVTYDPNLVQDIFYHGDPEIRSFFQRVGNGSTTPGGVPGGPGVTQMPRIEFDDLITYKNWSSEQ